MVHEWAELNGCGQIKEIFFKYLDFVTTQNMKTGCFLLTDCIGGGSENTI